jgi:hypothetical protein
MTNTINNSEFDAMADLNALFENTRNTQPNLHDDNFTKVIINSLPDNNFYAANAIEQKRVSQRSLSMDTIGGLVGLVLVFMFMDMGGLMNSVLKLVPESITLSPLLIVAGFISFTFVSIGAWWSIENNKI